MRDDDQVLLNWLETLPEEALARLLALRAESLEPPWPRHLRALAERIGEPAAVTTAIRGLPTPAVQVLRALAALPVGATKETLASFLGLPQDDPDLARILATLAEQGLAWIDAGNHVLCPAGQRTDGSGHSTSAGPSSCSSRNSTSGGSNRWRVPTT
jgi:hypothetical protein